MPGRGLVLDRRGSPSVRLSRTNLHEPAALGASRLLLGLLGRAEKAARAAAHPHEPGALHGLRVSLRKLRSTQRSLAPWLGRAAAKGMRRRLRQLAVATNDCRDAEVQRDWLEARLAQRGVASVEKAGIRLMLDDLDRQEQGQSVSSLAGALRAFHDVAVRMRRRLNHGDRAVRALGDADDQLLSGVIADQVTGLGDRLRGALRQVNDPLDVQQVHDIRLLVKRLRYTVESNRSVSPQGRRVLRSLKFWQDQLGSLHDLQVLQDRVVQRMARVGAEWALRLARAELEREKSRPQPPAVALPRADCLSLACLLGTLHEAQNRITTNMTRAATDEKLEPLFKGVEDLVIRLRTPAHVYRHTHASAA